MEKKIIKCAKVGCKERAIFKLIQGMFTFYGCCETHMPDPNKYPEKYSIEEIKKNNASNRKAVRRSGEVGRSQAMKKKVGGRKMKEVIILKGLPASGKSTWAKQMITDNPGQYKRVNKDDLRAMLDNSAYSKSNEKFVLKLQDMIILQALEDGKHVIVDNTHLNPIHEERIANLVKGKAIVRTEFFDISLQEAIERDLKRPISVGEQVIRKMYNDYLKPNLKENQNDKLPKAIICDLDGTLALHNNRSPYEYDKCDTDWINQPVLNLLNSYTVDNVKPYIIFVSGREDSCMLKTAEWLSSKCSFGSYNITNEIALFDNAMLCMRKTGDNRADFVVKAELYNKHVKDRYYVEVVIDDRNQVVDLWRDLGLNCWQVNYGNF